MKIHVVSFFFNYDCWLYSNSGLALDYFQSSFVLLFGETILAKMPFYYIILLLLFFSFGRSLELLRLSWRQTMLQCRIVGQRRSNNFRGQLELHSTILSKELSKLLLCCCGFNFIIICLCQIFVKLISRKKSTIHTSSVCTLPENYYCESVSRPITFSPDYTKCKFYFKNILQEVFKFYLQ